MKQTEKSANGTSFHGYTITTTANVLIGLIGEPSTIFNNGTDKVNIEWTMENENGDVFTIYDWKEGRPISFDEKITWHIGSHKTIVSGDIQTLLKAKL